MDKKTRHEEFVTGLAGGSVLEIYVILAVVVLSIIVQHFVSKQLLDYPSHIACDFIFNWLVVLAAITFYANRPYLLAAVLLATLFLAVVSNRSQTTTAHAERTSKKGSKHTNEAKNSKKTEPKEPLVAYRPFITNYRSAMMVLTMTAILAVDFTVFPRRFAKTETWGTSLMDLGVGSFVFSLGIVSARKELKAGSNTLQFKTEVAISIKQTLKVFALGLVRLVTTKSLDYQEHVSEYGLHWNFFFTLSLLPISFVFVRRFNPFVKLSYTVKGILIALTHELLLKNTGLLEWTLTAPRVTLISQNKEGIVSFTGYLAIFTFGYSLGLSILSGKTSLKQIIKQSGVWAAAAQVAFMVFRTATEPSRRLANLTYISWIVAFNSGFVALLALVEMLFEVPPSDSYNAVNKFGETMFVVANLATGVVNLSFDTVLLDKTKSIIVLIAYLAFLMAFAMMQVRYRK